MVCARLDRLWMALRQWWGERHGGYLSPFEDQMEHWPEPSQPAPPDIEPIGLPGSGDEYAPQGWDASLRGEFKEKERRAGSSHEAVHSARDTGRTLSQSSISGQPDANLSPTSEADKP